jgi:hypothetical protein
MDRVEFRGISFLVATPPPRPISIQNLSAIEDQLGFLFPEDYRAFITTLGVGETDLSIRVLPPQYILDSGASELHSRLSEHWFWDKSLDVLTQAQAIECIPFFDFSNVYSQNKPCGFYDIIPIGIILKRCKHM